MIVVSLLASGCLGGSSGEPAQGIVPTCIIARTAPAEVQTKFSGTYTTEWGLRAAVDHECPPSEGTFEARVDFVVRDGNLPRRSCGTWDPDWYTVVVELRQGDGSLQQTRSGLLSTHGTIELDGGEEPRSLVVRPDAKWLSIGLYTTSPPSDMPQPPDIVSRPPWCPSGEMDGQLPDVVETTDFGVVEPAYYEHYRATPGPSIPLQLLGVANRGVGELTLTPDGRGEMSIVLSRPSDEQTLVFDGVIDRGAPEADGTLDTSLHFFGQKRIDGSFFVGLPEEVTGQQHDARLSVDLRVEGSTFVVSGVYLELGSEGTVGLLRTIPDSP